MPPADTSQAAYNVALPVKNLIKRPPVLIAPNATVAEAAAVMQNARIGSVLVAADPLGIVTDRDLRGRVLAAGFSSYACAPGWPLCEEKEALDHSVQWTDLSTLERRHLKEGFIAVKHVQDELPTAWRLDRVT